jgi:hypothetical protein
MDSSNRRLRLDLARLASARGVGWDENFLQIWLGSWGLSWVVAFPVLMVLLPLVRRLTALIVQSA